MDNIFNSRWFCEKRYTNKRELNILSIYLKICQTTEFTAFKQTVKTINSND